MSDSENIENIVDEHFAIPTSKNNNILKFNDDDNDSVDDSDIDNDNDSNNDDDNDNDNDSDDIVGIDFGTTNSCVGIWRNNNFEVIPDKHGNHTIPSIVAYTSITRYVGKEAKNQKELNPKNVFYEIKRLIGRKRDDDCVKNDLEFITYDIDSDSNGNVIIVPEFTKTDRVMTPEEIGSVIFMELKQMACEYLKKEITKAIISVPAYFNDSQRQATKDAATIAGIDCIRMINEPTAAALAYGLMNTSLQKQIQQNEQNEQNEKLSKEMTVIVYDLGGGTLDVSMLSIDNGVFEVLGTVGNSHTGGSDFDNKILAYCLKMFKYNHKIDKLASISTLSMQQLRKACENAKKILSINPKITISVKNFHDGKHLIVKITREKFNELCRDLLIFCLKSLDDIMRSTGKQKEDIDEIILVGGMTRVPAIYDNIKKFFLGKEPNCSINPDEAITMGAAIQGYIISHRDDPFSDFITLLDIVPLSFGVETIDGVMNKLIPRNSIIPITRKRRYTTDTDDVTSVKIKVYEGEREMTKDNFCVGEFLLDGLDSAPRGHAKIDVKFKIDVNGIITVFAEDVKNPENKQSVTITGNKGRLTQDEIKHLVGESKEHEKKDKIEREQKQNYYEIDDLCSNIILNLNDEEFKLRESDKKMISEEITSISLWLKEKKFSDRNKNEYVRVIKKIRKKYATLILKVNNTDELKNKIKSVNVNAASSTTIYGDDDDDNDNANEDFEKIEDEYMGIELLSDVDKQEIKHMRNDFMELCENINDVIGSDVNKMDEEHNNELRDFIDDAMLWIHVQDKLTKNNIKQKIDDINEACDKMIAEYDEKKKDIFKINEIKEKITCPRHELEQLCYALKSSIMSNMFSLPDDKISSLSIKINDITAWLNVELSDDDVICDDEYVQKINELNDECNDMYQNMVNINIASNNILPENDNAGGTNISDIIKKKQNDNVIVMPNVD